VIVLRWAAALGLVLGAGCTCAGRALPAAGGSGSGGASSGTAGATSTTGAPLPDVPSNCHPEQYGECDPWCQDCPEGQKCTAWSTNGYDWEWNATRCVPVAPDPKQVGEPCTVEGGPSTGLDDCAKGAICWSPNPDTGIGRCVRLCTGSPEAPECPMEHFCGISNEGVLILCLPWCDPFGRASRGCDAGASCYLFRNGDWEPTTFPVSPLETELVCVLRASGYGGTGDPCDFATRICRDRQCVPKDLAGVCTDNPSLEADGCCAAWCDLSAPECPDGGTCQRVFEPGHGLDPIYENLGLCLAP